MARELGVDWSLACTSGTAALRVALRALGVGPGDEVIIPTYVCWNVLAAVKSIGAMPRLCDVDDSGVLTARSVAPAVRLSSRAVIAVHTFGHPCDIVSLMELGLPVIEDACQAFGLKIALQPAGTLGTVGCFSFHATKCFTAGEGGMLVCRDAELMKRMKSISGSDVPYNEAGTTAMSDIQASLALSQLSRYGEFLRRRVDILSSYEDALEGVDARPGYAANLDFLFRFTLRTSRDFMSLRETFLQSGVHIRRGVDELLHRRMGMPDVAFPEAVRLFQETVSLPFYPGLSDGEIEVVARSLRDVLRAH